MIRYPSILILVLSLLTGISCSEKKQEMIFPEGLNTMSLNDSIKFNPEWYEYKYKIVTYLKGGFPLSSNWEDPMRKFPQIAFIFYLAEKDATVLKQKLNKYNFLGPVVHDPENKFFELNRIDRMDLNQHNFLLFAVKDNTIIDMPGKENNPSFPQHFEKYLNGFIKE